MKIPDIRKIDYATRVKVSALLLLTLTALLINLAFLVRKNKDFRLRSIGQDEVSLYEKRFGELKGSLPPRTVVGYISDETDEVQETKNFYLTQYELAPVLVVRGTERPLVVGNFSHDGKDSQSLAGDLVSLKDFGNGVVLYSKETK